MNIDYILSYWFIAQCACVVYCGISVDMRLQPVIDRVLIITTILTAVAAALLILGCHYFPPAYEQLNRAYGVMLLFILCSPITVFLCRQHYSITRLRLTLKISHYTHTYTFFWLRAAVTAFFIIGGLTLSMTDVINNNSFLCGDGDNGGFIWGVIGMVLALCVHAMCIHAMKEQLYQLTEKR